VAHSPLPFRIISCNEWGARAPRGLIKRVGKPDRTIFHHTAGHVPNLGAGERYDEACAYARAIQGYHMNGNGWNDSGHNFLITRGGYILEGRHGSLSSIAKGLMVTSAHCPGQNDQPGIEVEHMGSDKLTPIQRAAILYLHEWICRRCGIRPQDAMQPHRAFFATACPGVLLAALPSLRADLAETMSPTDAAVEAWWDKYGPANKPDWFFKALQEYARRLSH
jgi:hypothetical protein